MWYVSSALKPLGPFEILEIQDKIKKGQVGPFDLVFHESTNEWKPAIEWTELRQLGFPAFESVKSDNFKDSIWIVLHKDSASQTYKQQGPFAGVEILEAVNNGKLGWEDLVWKKGLSGWARLSDREEFTSPDL